MSKDILKDYLKTTKSTHFNFEDKAGSDYIVSTGSLILDIATGGGIRPGILRLSGVTEGGKTSMALSVMYNFLKGKNRKAVYIKSEGRMSPSIQKRSGIKFTRDSEDWDNGSCFIFETNVYETAIGLVRSLVYDEENKETKYFFIIDSTDSLIPFDDLDKDFSESIKVAGGALLASTFLKRLSLAFSARGHICTLISQVRNQIKINPYEKGDPKVTNASGGNAQLHYSDWIMEFQQRWSKDIITGEKDKIVGHFCKVMFRKTPNETTGSDIKYPIKYGQENASSIWKSFEIAELLVAWEMVSKSGAWLKVKEDTMKIIKDAKLECPEQFQGLENFRTFLDENPKLTELFASYFKDRLM